MLIIVCLIIFDKYDLCGIIGHMKKDVFAEFSKISVDDVRKAIERINQGVRGADISQSNSEIVAARSTIDGYLLSYADLEERHKQEEIINKALGISDYEGSTSFNFTDRVVGNGSNRTEHIQPSNTGTGLPRQIKTPRSTRDKTFLAPEE